MKKNKKKACVLLLKLSVLIFISNLFFNACNENSGEFILGEEFIESQTDINLIDTFSVSLSTVIFDSIITSGTGNLLVGNYKDDVFGKITCNSYFQIGIPESFDVLHTDHYDSLKLFIIYNNYSFGDTTKTQKILLHQLTRNIKANDDNIITSVTTFPYNPNPAGSVAYTPTPGSEPDTLFIRVSDDIGLDLFAKLRDDSEILTDDASFINYFHGLVLAADEAYEGSIIGFNADEDNVKLVLYTSREDLTTEKITYEFPLNDINKQFNNIEHDFTSTQLSSLTEQKTKLPSTKTGGLAYLQGGIGVALRVDFPTLQQLPLLPRGKIMAAELSISPLTNSYNDFELPTDLYPYETDKLNKSRDLVVTNLGGTAISILNLDNLYQEESAYSFDVTKYLNDELANSYIDPEKGLLITLSTSALSSRFHRVIIDAQNKNTKLKIYYLSY